MASLNKVQIIGNLGSDPEVRHAPGGQAVATMNVATNERWKNKAGELQERVEWHRVVVWGVVAENCGKYLEKGRSVYVEGRLTTRKWEDKEGRDRYTTEVVAQTVQFLGAAPAGSGTGSAGRPPTPPTPTDNDMPPPRGGDDDIPF